MKKTVATSLAAVMLLSASSAMAASFPEFQLNGDVKLHYRWNENDKDGGKFWFRLNATSEVAKNLTFYTRFSTQFLSSDNVGADFYQAEYHDDHATTIDRFGFILKGKGFDYTIGRQDLFLGQGLLVDSTGYFGKHTGAIDGVKATGKSGITDLTLVAGQAWGQPWDKNADEAKIYAIDASYSPAKDWKLGATLAKVTDRKDGDDSTHYGINASYTAGKATYFGEYGKSDADSNDKGYAIGASYDLDKKNSIFAIYNRVEGNVEAFEGMTTYDTNGKGMYYGFSHKIDANTTFDLFYKDMKTIDKGEDYRSFRTTVTYKF